MISAHSRALMQTNLDTQINKAERAMLFQLYFFEIQNITIFVVEFGNSKVSRVTASRGYRFSGFILFVSNILPVSIQHCIELFCSFLCDDIDNCPDYDKANCKDHREHNERNRADLQPVVNQVSD